MRGRGGDAGEDLPGKREGEYSRMFSVSRSEAQGNMDGRG